MSEAEDARQRIDAVVQVALRVAMSTTTGRIALVKAAANVDPSWIPGPWRDSVGTALGRAARATPLRLAFPDVEQILRRAWGVRRVGDELESLDPEPVAVTPTSQVHRGVRDGEPVAVKVLRPGLARAVRQDLALLDGLLTPLAGAVPGLDLSALLAEARERTMDEFDLEHEAQVMRRFGRALHGGPVVVPVPVTDLCRETVLVSSWLEGEPLSGEVGLGHDLTAAALLRFVLGGLREGLMHCDLDADDVLILADGRVGVVDFGAVAVIERDRADLCLEAVAAFVDGDPAGLDGALVALGVLAPGHGDAALAVATEVLGELGGATPSQLDVAAIAAALDRVDGVESPAAELLLAGRLVPSYLYPARGVAQLVSLIARIGATGVWREQVTGALAGGWQG
jgi:predicted unusual protein kinase regulating ubiquinone biosynthesis (AarF/ABC1/UbiB family)